MGNAGTAGAGLGGYGAITCGPVGLINCGPPVGATWGPTSMCSGAGTSCGECRAKCTTVDALGTCSRTAYPQTQRYEYPGVGQSTPRNPLDSSPSPLSARHGGNACVGAAGGVALGAGTDLTGKGAGSASSKAATSPADNSRAQQAKIEAQQLVKNFVQNIVKGISVTMLPDTGGATKCVVSLDRKLNTMWLQRAAVKSDSKKRSIPLEQINSIVIGDDLLADEDLPATEMCVTLFLEGSQPLTLEFPDLEERDTFALCLSMFVAGRQREVEL